MYSLLSITVYLTRAFQEAGLLSYVNNFAENKNWNVDSLQGWTQLSYQDNSENPFYIYRCNSVSNSISSYTIQYVSIATN